MDQRGQDDVNVIVVNNRPEETRDTGQVCDVTPLEDVLILGAGLKIDGDHQVIQKDSEVRPLAKLLKAFPAGQVDGFGIPAKLGNGLVVRGPVNVPEIEEPTFVDAGKLR